MSFIDPHGKTVPPHIALDASGQLRAGFRRAAAILAPGEKVSFDATVHDAAPAAGVVFLTDAGKPFISPSQARQAEIMADIAATSAALRYVNDQNVAQSVAAAIADRATGSRAEDVSAIRDARYTGAAVAASAPSRAFADNSHVVSAIRAARYL
ncbi:hypothetical protein [Novosphingobium sp. EMRT-2]|uniref:hypothetical protein n=1 Tax=Novosphingobium sp. EMRT-2 TaxID=2571749 RepID=UPI0010BD7E2A|nr:hypothetical protein [Novosphingobium sp. EMRT-2]QCI92123.1 hypothetical protein FA702_00085 [Novosphingobium sp. EMRT-2]QCI95161.1 hypothetical protein FA702_17710 [Novosphingobium sp. EMRT-2]